jgi:DndB-like DNA-sulfur modification-associated protein
MIPSTNGLPAPLGTLDDVLDAGDASEKAMKVFVGHNLGNRSFLMSMPMHEFYGMSEVANDPGRDGDTIAQRKLDPAHAQRLGMYILKGLVSASIERRQLQKKPESPALNAMMDRLGRQPYMALQPLVVNIRDCNPQGADIRAERMLDRRLEETAGFRIYLAQRHVLWVIDGQHRRKAMQMVFDFLENVRQLRAYPKKNGLVNFLDDQSLSPDDHKVWEECFEVARSYCTVLVEVHLGLEPTEERQLFHDLNRLGKKVDTSLALQFDSSNPINQFLKEDLIEKLGLEISETDVKNWQDDEGKLPRKDLVSVNAILFLNRSNISSATPASVEGKTEIAHRFWTAIQAIPGFGEELAREKTVAAQPVVLKALAKLVYDFSFSNRRPENGPQLTDKLISEITDIDFSHENQMWRYYELTAEEKKRHGLAGLENFLPPDDGGNRDIGSFQNGFMRFGAKHNDIIPLLGDMIRWKLDLPPRRLNSSSQAEVA